MLFKFSIAYKLHLDRIVLLLPVKSDCRVGGAIASESNHADDGLENKCTYPGSAFL